MSFRKNFMVSWVSKAVAAHTSVWNWRTEGSQPPGPPRQFLAQREVFRHMLQRWIRSGKPSRPPIIPTVILLYCFLATAVGFRLPCQDQTLLWHEAIQLEEHTIFWIQRIRHPAAGFRSPFWQSQQHWWNCRLLHHQRKFFFLHPVDSRQAVENPQAKKRKPSFAHSKEAREASHSENWCPTFPLIASNSSPTTFGLQMLLLLTEGWLSRLLNRRMSLCFSAVCPTSRTTSSGPGTTIRTYCRATCDGWLTWSARRWCGWTGRRRRPSRSTRPSWIPCSNSTTAARLPSDPSPSPIVFLRTTAACRRHLDRPTSLTQSISRYFRIKI